jgi:putative oxidoreductase
MVDARLAPYAVLLLRVTLGSLAIAHLYWKFYVLPGGLQAWWQNLNMQGYPDWVVYYVLSGEFAGAILLIPGVMTRWVGLYALPLMLGAAQYWIVRKGFFFVSAGAEMPLLWSVTLVIQAMRGDGAYALVPSAPFPFLGSRKAAHA